MKNGSANKKLIYLNLTILFNGINARDLVGENVPGALKTLQVSALFQQLY